MLRVMTHLASGLQKANAYMACCVAGRTGTMHTANGLINQWATGVISSLDVVKGALDNVADNAAAPLTLELSKIGAGGGVAQIET